MTDGIRLAVCSGLTEFELDDHLLLYAARSQAIFVLSPTAAFVWSCVTDGSTVSEAISELAHATGISRRRAELDVRPIVNEWIERGLLRDSQHAEQFDEPNRAVPRVPSRTRTQNIRSVSAGEGEIFQVLDFKFRFDGPDRELIGAIETLFAHLGIPHTSGAAVTEISLQCERGEWRLLGDSQLLATCDARESVVPLVYTFVHMLAYRQSRAFAAVHAAAVVSGEHCVLMPGASGSGKSTLAAALVAAGMSCYADDMAVLSLPPIRLRAFPARIVLKDGSWRLLGTKLPQIEGLPSYDRKDGRRVKYLLPSHSPLEPSGAQVPVTHLVFPKYVAASETRVLPVPRAIALSMLTSAGYDVPGRISAEWVGAAAAWMRELHCFTLEFGDLDDAVRTFTSLL